MRRNITYFFNLLFAFGLSANFAFAQDVQLNHVGTYYSDVFDESAAEIVAYDPTSQRLFVVNANDAALDVLDLTDPSNPTLITQLDMTTYGGGANSVAVNNGVVAVAVENDNAQLNGVVVFLDTAGTYINDVTVGALPDMVTFTPDGNYLLVANEGEPDDDYILDPEGSISIIDMSNGASSATVSTADFTKYNTNPPTDPSIRIYGNNGMQTFAQDVEPEYIAVSADSKTAFVSLQENNAMAVVDIENADITNVYGFGFKDHSVDGNGLDASDRDDSINIRTWPVKGMPQPDAIAAYEFDGTTYIVTANEGDARDYDGYSEEDRIKDITLDSVAFPNYRDLQEDDSLGRLNITLALGDTDNDGEFEELYSYGTRSFSIYDESGSLVFDSGDDFETITAMENPDYFNANNDENDSFESRSDNKGPEPEGVALATFSGRTFAFIGLERVGGIMVYEVTDPENSVFVQYINNRDFSQPDTARATGDLGPEGLLFIPKADSPNGKDLLVVGNEVSGTTSVFEIDVLVGIDEKVNEAKTLSVYPNPSSEGLINFNEIVSGQLIDASGRVIRSIQTQKTLNVSNIEKGMYVFVTDGGRSVKVILQ